MNNEEPKDDEKGKCVKLSFADLVQSVLPWPFRKDLPANYCGKKPGDKFRDLVRLARSRSTTDKTRAEQRRGDD